MFESKTGDHVIDLTDEEYGFWTVLGYTGKKTRDRGVIWLCKCECGTIREVSGKVLKNESKPRSCGCIYKIKSKEIFESNYKKRKTGCWIWKGNLNQGGYGKIGSKGLAHRRAYEYAYGKIPKGNQVCHSCDVRNCVRPDHMFLGSIGDNMRDKNSKNRQAKGSSIGSSILTEDQVLEIRKMRLSGKMYKEISCHFKIQWGLVVTICQNRQWKHVPLGEECKAMKQIRRTPRGSCHKLAILDEKKVSEIRYLHSLGHSARELGEKYGICLGTAFDAIRRRTWTHVP